MFKRLHHRQIAFVLSALNAPLLREQQCLFAGGTVMAMRFGEYRESVDIDFLVSDLAGYRQLRQLIKADGGISNIFLNGVDSAIKRGEVRADQYGIRTELAVNDQPIKFEIVHEARIDLCTARAEDEVCGVATLTPLDMLTSKLLANSDRWADDGAFSRDVIDIAMMKPPLPLLRQAVAKAEAAYGQTIITDLDKAIKRLGERDNWLDRCMEVMKMDAPKAVVWSSLRSLRKVLS